MPIAALFAKIPLWAWALLIALGAIGWQHIEIRHARAEADAARSETAAVKAANIANLATISKLQQANTDWASKCKANQPEARHEAQLSAQGDAKRQAEASKSIASLRATYEHEPTVKAWASVPLPRVVADRLRQAGNPY